MTTNIFRISSIKIKNFRGVTEERQLNLEGKHVFIFGPNGFGKSTVVESIRWCLFGSPPGQQEIEVRNTFFPGNSTIVELLLESERKNLLLQRTLTPGALRSRQLIKDQDGNELRQQEAFPLLTKLGNPTGTQVIFAAQHAAGRRQAEISEFSKILYFYLEIESIPELLEKIKSLIEERHDEHQSMANDVDSFAGETREKINVIRGKKEEILKNPPWGEETVPTHIETDHKIEKSFQEMASICQIETPSGLSNNDKLLKIIEWNNLFISKKNNGLEERLEELEKKQQTIDLFKSKLSNLTESVQQYNAKITESQNEENTILAGKKYENLIDRLNQLKITYDKQILYSHIQESATEYLSKYKGNKCPVCNTELNSIPVSKQNTNNYSEYGEEINKIEIQISKVHELRKEIEEFRRLLSESESNLKEVVSSACTLLNKETIEISDLDFAIEEITKMTETIQGHIENAQAEYGKTERHVKGMQSELRFHDYQRKIRILENILSKEIETSRDILREYASVLETSEHISKLLLEAFNCEVDNEIPKLNEEISRVFVQLTKHPSYDGIAVYKQPSRSDKQFEPDRLELQVTSSKRPGQTFPSNVLNGQATRALQLVPYFVFSEYWKNVMELDLLLVDDPSESFDTSHLDNLLSVLKIVASHTQIILASHEGDKLLPLIGNYFLPDDICILQVTNFDPYDGPCFAQ